MCKNKKDDYSTDLEVVDIKDNAQDSYHDDMDQVMQNVNNIKSNLGSIAKSFFNFTSDSVNDLNNKARDYSMNWLSEVDDESNEHIREMRRHFKRFFNDMEPKLDEYFPRPYQSREDGHHGQFPTHFSPWLPGRDHYPHFFGGSRKCGKTPFGFYSYKTPSIRQYHDCMEKKGESVWDSYGYWRCLFPNSEVPTELLKLKNEKLSSEILTKDDFNNAVNNSPNAEKDGTIDLGDKGVYFRQFTDFLNWKSIMYENMKREKAKKRHEFIEKRKQRQALNEANLTHEGDANRSVLSSSVQSNFSTNSDTNEFVLNETRTEFYDDGTSCTRTITKSKPFDAKDWVNVTENVEHGTGGKKGWFWNSKDN